MSCRLTTYYTLWIQDRVCADATTAYSTGVLVRFLENTLAITRDEELGLLHVDMAPFTFYASLPCHELGNTLLLGVHDEHQVIGVEELPWYTSAEFMRQRLHLQNEEQWAKDITLMHTNSNTQLLTLLTIHLHTNLGPGWNAQPIPGPQGSLWPTIGPSLAPDRRLYQGL